MVEPAPSTTTNLQSSSLGLKKDVTETDTHFRHRLHVYDEVIKSGLGQERAVVLA